MENTTSFLLCRDAVNSGFCAEAAYYRFVQISDEDLRHDSMMAMLSLLGKCKLCVLLFATRVRGHRRPATAKSCRRSLGGRAVRLWDFVGGLRVGMIDGIGRLPSNEGLSKMRA